MISWGLRGRGQAGRLCQAKESMDVVRTYALAWMGTCAASIRQAARATRQFFSSYLFRTPVLSLHQKGLITSHLTRCAEINCVPVRRTRPPSPTRGPTPAPPAPRPRPGIPPDRALSHLQESGAGAATTGAGERVPGDPPSAVALPGQALGLLHGGERGAGQELRAREEAGRRKKREKGGLAVLLPGSSS